MLNTIIRVLLSGLTVVSVLYAISAELHNSILIRQIKRLEFENNLLAAEYKRIKKEITRINNELEESK